MSSCKVLLSKCQELQVHITQLIRLYRVIAFISVYIDLSLDIYGCEIWSVCIYLNKRQIHPNQITFKIALLVVASSNGLLKLLYSCYLVEDVNKIQTVRGLHF